MDDEFFVVNQKSVELAYEILNEFKGAKVDIVIEALVVILTELILQICPNDRTEATAIAISICASVAENLKRTESLGPLAN
jgi:hypothetical protein